MFRRKPQNLDDLIPGILNNNGLTTQLLQRRLLSSWEEVAGPTISRLTKDKYIQNQTLVVKILNPSMRQDLSMMRQEIVNRLNEHVGAKVIFDVRFI